MSMTPDTDCNNCVTNEANVSGNADLTAFFTACGADSTCNAFNTLVQMCPAP